MNGKPSVHVTVDTKGAQDLAQSCGHTPLYVTDSTMRSTLIEPCLFCQRNELLERLKKSEGDPVPMLLWCPECGERHVDVGVFATKLHHHTHACQSCGMVWRPAIVPTVGVQWLPGFKNER